MATFGGQTNNKYFDLTPEQRKQIPLLPSFECKRCKKSKTPDCYAQKELNNYRFKVGSGIKLNAKTSQLCCRVCKGEQVHELQCEGPCSLIKVLDEFSKAQRTRGSRWCKQCVLWKEAAEPGVVTAAAPNGDLAPDEEDALNGYSHDPEGEADSDEYDDDVTVPYEALSAMSVSSTVNKEEAENNTSNSSAHGWMPPHLRGIDRTVRGTPSTTSSVSNPYEDRSQTMSQTGWSAVDARRHGTAAPGITYNAYDASGQLHTRQRAPSTSVDTPSGSGAASVFQVSASQPVGRTNNWAKPVGQRREAPKFPEPTRPFRQQQQHDSESDDEP